MKLDGPNVVGSTASLNVTLTGVVAEIFAAPAAGSVEMTLGGVTSGGTTVADGESADTADTTPEIPFADTAYR